LGLLTNLVRFEVTGNALTGTLPQTLSHWTKLQHLDLSNNQLNISALLARDDNDEDDSTGSIDNHTLLGETWNDLVHLDVHSNQAFGDFGRRGMAGSLPNAFGQAWANLVHLDASDAALVGSLSNTIGQAWTQLRYFNVSVNHLTGSLPESMADWTHLETADLQQNDLVGTVLLDLCRNAVQLTTLCLESTRVDCTTDAAACCSCRE
jgi:Leucine Rich Repeat